MTKEIAKGGTALCRTSFFMHLTSICAFWLKPPDRALQYLAQRNHHKVALVHERMRQREFGRGDV